MSVHVTGAPKQFWGRPDSVGPGRQRKVAIIGSHSGSVLFAPYRDPTWEVWAHSSCAQLVPKGRADRLFDVHPRHCFEIARKNGFLDYFAYLKACKTPIWMQEVYPDIPQSQRYPIELVRSLWPDVPLGSQTAEMIALALIEGVTHLGFWGVHYSHGSDYEESRPNCEQWIGIARGMGVQIVIPSQSPLCHEPREVYGYETHATPEKYAERLKKFAASMFGKGGLAPTAVEACETAAQESKALALRRLKDPNWAKAIDAIPEAERFPEWLRKEEDDQRAAAGLPPLDDYQRTPTGLSRPDAGSEVPASGLRVSARQVFVPADGAGEAPRNGLVQSGLPVVSSWSPDARGSATHRAASRRTTVARPRPAARHRRARSGARKSSGGRSSA